LQSEHFFKSARQPWEELPITRVQHRTSQLRLHDTTHTHMPPRKV